MATKYRKLVGRYEYWHFHTNCPDWPETNYFEENQLADHEEICQRCIELGNRSSSDPNVAPKKS